MQDFPITKFHPEMKTMSYETFLISSEIMQSIFKEYNTTMDSS